MIDLSPEELARARKNNLSPEKYARLKAESKAPYRGLRKFFYVAFGASGLIGAFVFLAKLAAGQDLANNLPNFALQIGVVALMVFLFRIDQPKNEAK
jgi:Low psii accumulation1 / Rep27